jgi:hypothetical protein
MVRSRSGAECSLPKKRAGTTQLASTLSRRSCCRRRGFDWDPALRARQLIDGAWFGPDALYAIREAFSAAWTEAAGNGNDPIEIEVARLACDRPFVGSVRRPSRRTNTKTPPCKTKKTQGGDEPRLRGYPATDGVAPPVQGSCVPAAWLGKAIRPHANVRGIWSSMCSAGQTIKGPVAPTKWIKRLVAKGGGGRCL